MQHNQTFASTWLSPNSRPKNGIIAFTNFVRTTHVYVCRSVGLWPSYLQTIYSSIISKLCLELRKSLWHFGEKVSRFSNFKGMWEWFCGYRASVGECLRRSVESDTVIGAINTTAKNATDRTRRRRRSSQWHSDSWILADWTHPCSRLRHADMVPTRSQPSTSRLSRLCLLVLCCCCCLSTPPVSRRCSASPAELSAVLAGLAALADLCRRRRLEPAPRPPSCPGRWYSAAAAATCADLDVSV